MTPIRAGLASAALAIAAALAAVLATVPANAPLAVLEDTALDAQFRLRGPLRPAAPIVLIDIDDKTLESMGGFPLDRTVLAEIIRSAKAAGARLIVPDILLPASRLTSPAADASLSRAISEAGNVLLPVAFLFQEGTTPPPELPAPVIASAFAVVREGRGLRTGVPHPSGVVLPDAPFLDAAGYGHVNVVRSETGGVSHAEMAVRFGEHYFPFLPAVVAARALGVRRSDMVLWLGAFLDIGETRLPLDNLDRLVVNHYGPADTFARIAARDLLDGSSQTNILRDSIAFISVTAAGVGDQFRSPFDVALPGTNLLATVTDNILSGRVLYQPAWSVAASFAAAFLLAWLSSWLVLASGLVAGIALALIATAGWLVIVQALFTGSGVLLPLPIPPLAVAPSVALAATWSMASTGRRRQQELSSIRETAAFAPVLSALAAELDQHAGPKTIICTVVFADLKGFTEVAQSAAPEAVHALMSRTLALLAEAAERHGGILVKSLGDGGMLLFGAPGRDVAAPARALDFVRETLATARSPAAGESLDIRFGAHCGPVSFGLIAAGSRREVDVAGDTVNVASRLQALTRKHDTTAIVSDQLIEAGVAAAGERARAGFRKAPRTRLRGRDRSIGIWLWQGGRELSGNA